MLKVDGEILQSHEQLETIAKSYRFEGDSAPWRRRQLRPKRSRRSRSPSGPQCFYFQARCLALHIYHYWILKDDERQNYKIEGKEEEGKDFAPFDPEQLPDALATATV